MIRELFLSDLSLWGCVWQSTALVAAGLVGSFILRNRSARAHQVLILSMIAAVFVPVMSVLVRHLELGVFVAEPVVIETAAEESAPANIHKAPATIPSEDSEPMQTLMGAYSTPVTADSKRSDLPWRLVVLYGWIAASLILTTRLLVTFVLGVCLLGRAQPLESERIEESVRLAKVRLGIGKDVKVYTSRGVRSPVIWCWRRRPVLLVPSAAGRSENRVDWTGVLCHELAHYKRRDHISGLLAELIVCILPWHPLLWWAKSRLISLSEQACDDWVVAAGQPGTDYAESLLNLTPQAQMAFAPAVVSSRKGLAGRVRRILKEGCGNPRTGTAWAIAVSVTAACIAVGVAFAQTRPEGRIVRFPTDRSVGTLSIQDEVGERELTYWFHWTGIKGPQWEELCEAQGDVHVPVGKRLSLNVNQVASRDLSWLSQLRPDDLYELGITVLLSDPAKPSDDCMPHIAHLTGLKSLGLDRTNVTDRGFEYIRNLKALEYLHMPMRVTDRGMAYVAQLPSLKGLYFGEMGSQVTDAGLRHLAKLNSLEELALLGERMGDYGLAHLRGLPRLKYLFLYGTHFTNKGCVHLKDIPSLKILSFYEGRCPITDGGLADVSKIATLESLSLNVPGPITDDGIAHLSTMRSLKKLDIASSQITDRGLGFLSQVKTLEHLVLPQRQKGITDKGLTYLGRLPNLRNLAISRTHFNDPNMNKEYYTDKGLAELANCRLLEDLSIGSIGITDAGMDHIAKPTNLNRLHMFGCDNLTDDGLAKLAPLKSLRNLDISHAKITFAGLARLNTLSDLTKLNVGNLQRGGSTLDLSGLANLEELGLNFKHYSEDAFGDADLACLAGLKKLRWLQIGARNFTDKGMAHLAGLTNMERLGIGGAGLTDEALKCLANMKKLNHLSILSGFDANKMDYVSGGKFTDAGLEHLEGLIRLRFLEICCDNNFSDAALQRLQRQLPDLFYLRINGRDAMTRVERPQQRTPTTGQPGRPAPVKPGTRRPPSRP